MAKTQMLCPFNEQICDECALYLGRHYYLSMCKHYRGYINGQKANGHPEVTGQAWDMKIFERPVTPWTDRCNKVAAIPDIRLNFIDKETGETGSIEPEKANDWDWGNTGIIRIIDGFHVTSWNKLYDILNYRAEKGLRHVSLYEGPRFMLLGGG